ncbi:hypothetical protein GALMADRAFT_272650 [Galerina marginata CBS 339.88]|uniref:RING-type domain-containing protein n=1 Tax=Galerina marginata (strain CBS 339.88) TaxID=685588 RepID=A0A067SNU1_GALM3|nr:hypothetical protein GALMADRAFT_272650 [Galerina marginata CBS 339.88]
MPTCPQCDNRQFSNKEALLQHLKTSSAWHPFCDICERRFASETAYESHMSSKHPPTYDCTTCNRSYHAPFALEDHYRGSVAHPNCVRCGRGFKDATACDEHHRTMHPKVPCTYCGGILIYEDALDQHYWDSHNHPSCVVCHRGFKDSVAYVEHFPSSHPELHCSPCHQNFDTVEAAQHHFWTSPVHPKCDECKLGFVDTETQNTHVETVHAPIPSPVENSGASVPEAPAPKAATNDEAIQPPFPQVLKPDIEYSTGFTPLSPQHRVPNLILGDKRVDSPDLRLKLNFTSPLTEVKPLFSPTSLPRPGDNIERIWSSKQNIQIATSHLPLTPSQSPPQNVETYSHVYRHTDPGPSRNSLQHSWFDPTRPSFRPRGDGRHFSPPQLSPPLVSPPRPDFSSRLYPGSVRQAMRAASLTRPGPSTDLQLGGIGSTDPYRGSQGHRSFGSGSGSVSGASHSSFGRHRGSAASDQVNWEELMGGGGDRAFGGSNGSRASLFSETLTPKAELPDPVSRSHLGIQVQNLTTSPSLATISSPASSALGHSPGSVHNEPDTRPTTASSTRTPSLHGLAYTITPSSECPSPRSPEVFSPAGLSVLPTISPLVSTPVDLISFDIPEAQKPLPDSPGELSPVTVVLDLKPQEPIEVTINSNSPFSTSSSQSFITSPQDPSDTTVTSIETAVTSPATPTVPSAPKLNPLHCRVCFADTCDDITASMCGHLFCNRCITDAVIKTNRCPVCMTPTLLYCLFRLDLGA